MKKYYIVIPLYNDWESLWKLSKAIDDQVKDLNLKFSFLFINDSSTEKKPLSSLDLDNIESITILNLKKNILSGRGIATGLKYLIENESFDYVITMDADGEDKPEDIIKLIKASIKNSDKTIVAIRAKRNVSLFYLIMYSIHIYMTYIFTGKFIKFGNFVLLPNKHVSLITTDASLWNCFSSSIVKNLLPILKIKFDRGKRFFGKSNTNYLQLIYHSLTIISVFRKKVMLRIIIFSILYTIFIHSSFTIFNSILLFVLLFFLIIIFIVSKRENLNGLLNSNANISSVEKIQ